MTIPAAVIEASNRAYLQAYERNSKLMGLLEQVANIDPEFRELRTSRSNAFVRRNARSIAKLQAKGQADPDLDPLLASRALSAMMSRIAFGHFVAAGEDRDDTPVATRRTSYRSSPGCRLMPFGFRHWISTTSPQAATGNRRLSHG